MASKKLKCAFCGKDQDEVTKLIASGAVKAGENICICDECVKLCNEILDGKSKTVVDQLDESVSSYKDIKEVMKNQEDLVDILIELQPLGCIKA